MPTKRTPREAVYAAIDRERVYQDDKHGAATAKQAGRSPRGNDRTIDEFVLYINGYANEAMRQASGIGEDAYGTLDTIRKIAALCVAAMEQHGAPRRKLYCSCDECVGCERGHGSCSCKTSPDCLECNTP